LRRKQALYPEIASVSPRTNSTGGIRELTRVLVERHTPLATPGSLSGQLLHRRRTASQAMPINAHILTAADDPVIPLADFLASAAAAARDARCRGRTAGIAAFSTAGICVGFAEEYVAHRLLQACSSPPVAKMGRYPRLQVD
jgi:hypothetical protein